MLESLIGSCVNMELTMKMIKYTKTASAPEDNHLLKYFNMFKVRHLRNAFVSELLNQNLKKCLAGVSAIHASDNS